MAEVTEVKREIRKIRLIDRVMNSKDFIEASNSPEYRYQVIAKLGEHDVQNSDGSVSRVRDFGMGMERLMASVAPGFVQLLEAKARILQEERMAKTASEQLSIEREKLKLMRDNGILEYNAAELKMNLEAMRSSNDIIEKNIANAYMILGKTLGTAKSPRDFLKALQSNPLLQHQYDIIVTYANGRWQAEEAQRRKLGLPSAGPAPFTLQTTNPRWWNWIQLILEGTGLRQPVQGMLPTGSGTAVEENITTFSPAAQAILESFGGTQR